MRGKMKGKRKERRKIGRKSFVHDFWSIRIRSTPVCTHFFFQFKGRDVYLFCPQLLEKVFPGSLFSFIKSKTSGIPETVLMS